MAKWMNAAMQAVKNFIEGIANSVYKYGKSVVLFATMLALFVLCFIVLLGGWMRNEVDEYINSYRIENVDLHRQSFNKSREFYSGLKTYMRQQRTAIGCNYMFLIEFHNGNENAITNIQFCKFDITIEVQDQTLPYAYTDDVVNENIFKYDLILSDRIANNKVDIYTTEELIGIDRRFYDLITCYSTNVEKIVITRIDYHKDAMGLLVLLFGDDIFSMQDIINCSEHIEQMITNNADEDDRKSKQKSK